MIDIVLVTEKACLYASDEVRHSTLAVEEDETLMNAFKKQNLNCKRVAWEDSDFDWSTTKIALIKSTWNYFYHIPEFQSWINKVAEKCKLVNHKDLILWNMDKHYLLELQTEGISTPQTFILDAKKPFEANEWNQKLGGKGFVVKPVISGGSKDTYYVKPPFNQVEIKSIQSAILQQKMMIQPFVQSIVEHGETSMVFIDGEFTHARVKKPKTNDFRVQPYHGGTLHNYNPTHEELYFGRKVLDTCKKLKGMPMYARVDFCYGKDDELLLMELEIIEPQLWYPESELAVSSLIEGIKKEL